MAEVLITFDQPIHDEACSYRARVIGRRAKDGMWEGWLEFLPLPERRGCWVLVSPVESRQAERVHLEYWAAGLSAVYAEGALRRAQRPVTVRVRAAEQPASERPATAFVTTTARIVTRRI